MGRSAGAIEIHRTWQLKPTTDRRTEEETTKLQGLIMPRNLPRDELVELFPGEDLISIKNKARSIKAKVPLREKAQPSNAPQSKMISTLAAQAIPSVSSSPSTAEV